VDYQDSEIRYVSRSSDDVIMGAPQPRTSSGGSLFWFVGFLIVALSRRPATTYRRA